MPADSFVDAGLAACVTRIVKATLLGSFFRVIVRTFQKICAVMQSALQPEGYASEVSVVAPCVNFKPAF
jgi:hypothetical protein